MADGPGWPTHEEPKLPFEPTDRELFEIHSDAANVAVAPYRWDGYDGVNDDGLRAVWRAGFAAGAAQ